VKVGVAGLGLIGGSLLRALGGVGYDADPAVRAVASAEGFAVAESLDGLAGCELVFVAVPPAVTYAVVDEVLAAVPDAVVADTASVKGDVPRRERFVAAHPMAGAETSGWAASSAELLRGATWAACPSSADLEPLLRLATAVDELGGRIVSCTPAEHDAAVARTSHVPHLVALALTELAPDSTLAGTAFRDMTRVAHADPALWAQILTANREAVGPALDELIARLAVLRGLLGDERALREAWEAGAR
jgi:prephenate dehydrogenase